MPYSILGVPSLLFKVHDNNYAKWYTYYAKWYTYYAKWYNFFLNIIIYLKIINIILLK